MKKSRKIDAIRMFKAHKDWPFQWARKDNAEVIPYEDIEALFNMYGKGLMDVLAEFIKLAGIDVKMNPESKYDPDRLFKDFADGKWISTFGNGEPCIYGQAPCSVSSVFSEEVDVKTGPDTLTAKLSVVHYDVKDRRPPGANLESHEAGMNVECDNVEQMMRMIGSLSMSITGQEHNGLPMVTMTLDVTGSFDCPEVKTQFDRVVKRNEILNKMVRSGATPAEMKQALEKENTKNMLSEFRNLIDRLDDDVSTEGDDS